MRLLLGHVANCQWLTANCRLPTADCLLPAPPGSILNPESKGNIFWQPSAKSWYAQFA
jgi:hypothetical protein